MKDLEKTVENTAVFSRTWSLILTEIKEQMNGLKSEIAQVSSSCASASTASADLLLKKINLMFDEVFKRLSAGSQSNVGDTQGHPTQSRSHHNYSELEEIEGD
ncbi:uncharacterized protein LOC141717217 [Apium graveolens]|uniref:uncharacterized protein LOC141717217 n=1 Tax=Apium graveolens TaxID=4045 RepID=UPI003D793425